MNQKVQNGPKSAEYTSDYKAGQDNVQVLGMDIHNPVFTTSALSILPLLYLPWPFLLTLK